MQGAGREGGGVGERKREENERSEQVELNFPKPAGLVELLPARAVVGTVFLETVLGRLQTEYTQEALVLLFLLVQRHLIRLAATTLLLFLLTVVT